MRLSGIGCDLVLNFIVCSNPTPGNEPLYFEPVRRDLVNCLEIGNAGSVVVTDPNRHDVKFWDDLLQEYNLLAAGT